MSEKQFKKIIVKLQADHDQDIAAGRQWWIDSTLAEKFAVWDCIQKPYNDPAMEVMSRFAQLAYTQHALTYNSRTRNTP